jgi:phospholipase C
MRCFDPSGLPVLTRLASEFCACTRWHASMPGPTWPNRFFAHGAQSGGMVSNRPIAVKSIFDSLCEARLKSRIYFHDIPQAFGNTTVLDLFLQQNQYFSVKRFRDLAKDVSRGDLAAYTFIEPQYFEIGDFNKGWQRWLYRLLAKLGLAGGQKANDQHPPHDVRMGERLIADVYRAIAKSKREYWRNTMLLIVYDEHGGLYDSKPVPPSIDPVPGGPHETDFSFNRYGVRVPAVVVSPYVVNHPGDATLYDHASICRTLERCLGLAAPLTARDAGANYIMGAFPTGRARGRWPRLAPLGVFPFTRDKERPLSDLQETLRDLAVTIANHERVRELHPSVAAEPVPASNSEPDARRYVHEVMKRLIE